MYRVETLTAAELDHAIACVEPLRTDCIVRRTPRAVIDGLAGRIAAFETVREFEAAGVADAWTIGPPGRDFQLGVLKGLWTVRELRRIHHARTVYTRERQHCECYCFVFLRLPWNLGRVLIRPESLTDKVLDLFVRQDKDFAFSPGFSRRYYVLTAGEDRFSSAVSAPFLDAIGARKKLWIEINGDRFFARRLDPASPEGARELAGLGTEVLAVGR